MIKGLLASLRLPSLGIAALAVPLLSAVFAASAPSSAPGSSCGSASSVRGATVVFPLGGSHDADLIAEAVLAEVNGERCAAGLSLLATEPTLNRAAAVHTADMVSEGFFAHRSPIAGRETPSDRITAAGGQFRRTAENLGQGWYMDYEAGRPFFADDAAACRFSYTDGTPINRHSYASLAEALVAAWMASPGHRENILRRGVSFHGLSVAPTGETTLCGKLYATQLFAG
ncbi:MAG: CAP domain-containing protein [Pseudomonadota bacterium]